MSAFSLTPVLPEAPLLGALPTEAVSKLREIFRSAARSEDFHNFSLSGRSQGSKKRTK
jgi:hypothetical protein